MTETLISFASVFTRDNEPDPLCSICFFIAPGGWAKPNTILNYLAHKIVPELAQIVPNSNANTIAFAIQDHMNEMGEQFGVECQGILTNYNLSISAKT